MNGARRAALQQSEALFHPVPAGGRQGIRLAERPASLEGLKIGFLGNLKPNCDVLLHATEEQVLKLGASATIYREKASCSLGAATGILDEIASNCQAAVVALGD